MLCADGEYVPESSDIDGSLNNYGDHSCCHYDRLKNVGPHHRLQASLGERDGKQVKDGVVVLGYIGM